MKTRYIWIHLAIKHILVASLLWFYLKPFANNTITAITVSNGTEVLGLILTFSGLVLAGGISGYFSFSYLGVNIPDISYVHLIVGHLVTSLLLLVIGILLFVAVNCISLYTTMNEIGGSLLILSGILYSALIFYDAFDLLKVRNFV